MDLEEYNLIENKFILLIDEYGFFEKNNILLHEFDINTNDIFKRMVCSLRELTKNKSNEQYEILKKYLLNFTETDFKNILGDIHNYENFDPKRTWLQTGYPVLGRWTDLYKLKPEIRSFLFNIIRSKTNLVLTPNNDINEPYLIIDIIPSYKYDEAQKCGGYEVLYNLGASNKLLLDKNVFFNMLELDIKDTRAYIFLQSFPIWGKLTDSIFNDVVRYISILTKQNKDVISSYELIKKDKKFLKKINEPLLENTDEFISSSIDDLDIDDYTIVKEISFGVHKYTFIETHEDNFSKLKRSDSTEIYSKLFDKVWIKK
jgi:hypothetical protein